METGHRRSSNELRVENIILHFLKQSCATRLAVQVVVPELAAEGHHRRGDRRRSSALHEPRRHGRVVAVGTLAAGQTCIRAGGSLEETAVHVLALTAVPVKGRHINYVSIATPIRCSSHVAQFCYHPRNTLHLVRRIEK